MTQRITATKIANWIESNYSGEHSPVRCVGGALGVAIPDYPDKLAIVTMLPGSGHSNEKVFENRTFQVRCRGLQNDFEMAENMSYGIDDLLNDVQLPSQFGDTLVNDIGWTGGGPSPLPVDDTSYRYTFVCSYFLTSATYV